MVARCKLIWSANRSSELRTLVEQVNYLRQLSVQFPVAPLRVIYTKAGSTLTAAYITDSAAIIDTSLYWATVTNLEEARYLVAILNSPAITRLVRPMQAVGTLDQTLRYLCVAISDPYLRPR